jgi:hypothetical protein
VKKENENLRDKNRNMLSNIADLEIQGMKKDKEIETRGKQLKRISLRQDQPQEKDKNFDDDDDFYSHDNRKMGKRYSNDLTCR